MTNPYQSPSSDLHTSTKTLKTKKWWKVFFWTILVLEIISIPTVEEELSHIITEITIYGAILTALFGFAYNKRILNKYVWAGVLPVGIGWEIYDLFKLLQQSNPEDQYITVFALIVVSPLLFLQYFGVYKYSFGSPDIWKH